MTETNTIDAPVIIGLRTPQKALIRVDTQVDFVMRHGKLSVKDAERIIVPGINFMTQMDPEEYFADISTYDTHVREEYIGSLENIGDPEAGVPGFDIHCEKGTVGWENVFNQALVNQNIERAVYTKTVFDMWDAPNPETAENLMFSAFPGYITRDDYFERLAQNNVKTITVLGVASDYCVKFAIKGLLERGFNVEVLEEATAGISREIDQVIAEDFPGLVTLI